MRERQVYWLRAAGLWLVLMGAETLQGLWRVKVLATWVGDELARDVPGDPRSHLLDDHGHLECTADRRNAAQQHGPVRVAADLQRLLQRVEVQDQGIGLDHLHGATTGINAIAIV